MNTENRLKLLLAASPQQLASVDATLMGEVEPERPSLKLYRIGQAATALGISRTSLWRAIKEKRIAVTEVRHGSFMILENELAKYAGVKQ